MISYYNLKEEEKNEFSMIRKYRDNLVSCKDDFKIRFSLKKTFNPPGGASYENLKFSLTFERADLIRILRKKII